MYHFQKQGGAIALCSKNRSEDIVLPMQTELDLSNVAFTMLRKLSGIKSKHNLMHAINNLSINICPGSVVL